MFSIKRVIPSNYQKGEPQISSSFLSLAIKYFTAPLKEAGVITVFFSPGARWTATPSPSYR